jgi:hypothetical protein
MAFNLEPEVRRRLEERGIDIERSYDAFQAEIRVHPPPLLMAHLSIEDFSKTPMRQVRDNYSDGKDAKRSPPCSEWRVIELYEEYEKGASLVMLADKYWQELSYKNARSAVTAIHHLFVNRGFYVRTKSEAAKLRWSRPVAA